MILQQTFNQGFDSRRIQTSYRVRRRGIEMARLKALLSYLGLLSSLGLLGYWVAVYQRISISVGRVSGRNVKKPLSLIFWDAGVPLTDPLIIWYAFLARISGRNFFEAGLETAERNLIRSAYLGETFQSFPWKLANSENDLGNRILFKNALEWFESADHGITIHLFAFVSLIIIDETDRT